MSHALPFRTTALAALAAALIAGCNGSIYVRDGVTDGDSFSLPPHALVDGDPVLQSWVAYGLARSVCQLEMGGSNPARNHSFDCELTARQSLLARWGELSIRPADPDEAAYLDALAVTADAGYLDEYVWHYLRRPGWRPPDALDRSGFDAWRGEHLARGHRAQTRIIGSWGYALRADGHSAR